MSILSKLITVLVAIASITLVIIGALSYSNAKTTLQQTHLSNLEVIADLKLREIDTYFSAIHADIEIATNYFNVRSNLPVLAQYISDKTHPRYQTARKQLDSQLQAFQRLKGLVDIMLVDLRGRIVYASNEKHFDKMVGHTLPDPGGKAFGEGKKRIFFTDIFRNPSDDGFEMLFSAPVRSFNNKLVGVIVFEISMEPIYALIQDTAGLGQTGETLLGKKIGDTILFLNRLRHDRNAALHRKVESGDSEALPIQYGVTGQNGSGVAVDYRGEQVIAAWRYLPSMNWGMVSKIDTSEAWASAVNLRNTIVLIGAVVLALVAVLALFVARSITKPIRALQSGAEIIGSGNLDYQVGTSAKDEIGRLSRAFDAMVQDLKKVMASRDELDEEVINRRRAEESLEQRTNELFESNVELQNINAYLQGILGNLFDAVVLIDEHRIIQSFNPAAERMFGYHKEEVLEKNVNILMPEPYRSEHDGYVQNYLTTGHAKIIGIGRDVTGLRKDGTTFPATLAVTEMHIGEERRFIGTIRDTTDLTHAIDELKTKSRELSRSNDELQQFAYVASHDLQEPLRMVVSFLGLVENEYADKLDDNGREYIHFAVDGGKRMKALIQGLLEYSRVQSQGKAFAVVDSEAILADALANLKFAIDDNGAEITHGNLPTVHADPGQLARLFQNLISNAIKFRGDQPPHVHISCQQAKEVDAIPAGVAGNDWLYCVQDNGIGFESGEKERIFKMFERLNIQSAYPGTGIGLSVCERIVHRHGGKIWAISEPEHGARFYFSLPNHKP